MRKGYECCCQLCAKKAWCEKNPNKGRQCCNVRQKTPECLLLIRQRWCTTCVLFVGRTEPFGADEPALPIFQVGGSVDAVATVSVDSPKPGAARPGQIPSEPLPATVQCAGKPPSVAAVKTELRKLAPEILVPEVPPPAATQEPGDEEVEG